MGDTVVLGTNLEGEIEGYKDEPSLEPRLSLESRG
jgi:hypothetical protein